MSESMPQPAPPRLTIALNVAGRPVLVVGLGPVGRRKAASLAEAGALVSGIDPRDDPAFVAELAGIPLARRWIEPYRAERLDAEAWALVALCAPEEVNRIAAAEAQNRGLWVATASEPERSDWILPARQRLGNSRATLALSTEGAGPALAAALVRRAAEAIQPWNDWIAAAGRLRAEARATIADPAQRRAWVASLASEPRLEQVRNQGVSVVEAQAREELRRLRGPLLNRDPLGESAGFPP